MCLAWTKVTLVTTGRLRTSHQLSGLPVPKDYYRNLPPVLLILAVIARGKRRRIFLVIMCSVGLGWQHHSSWMNPWCKEPRV